MDEADILSRLRGLINEKLAPLAKFSDEELIAFFQNIHGLQVTGDLDPVTTRKILQPRFCGVKDNASATRARWDHTLWNGRDWVGTPANMRLAYFVADSLPGFSMQATQEAFAQALQSLAVVCAVDFVRLDNPAGANLLYKIGKIDEAGSTLAWCELPYGKDTPATTLNSLVDQSEPWVNSAAPPNSKLDIVRVIAHETGHGLGMEHGPEGALLAPYYDRQIRTPQAYDIQELQLRYGPRVVDSPAPVPPANQNIAVVTIDVGGMVYHGDVPPVI